MRLRTPTKDILERIITDAAVRMRMLRKLMYASELGVNEDQVAAVDTLDMLQTLRVLTCVVLRL